MPRRRAARGFRKGRVGCRRESHPLWGAADCRRFLRTRWAEVAGPEDKPNRAAGPVQPTAARRRGHDITRRRRAAEIGRLHLPLGEDLLDGARHRVVRVALPEVIEHQRAGPDRGDRIGDALAGDVGRRAVDRLEHRRVRPLRVDVGAGRDAEAARDRRAEVGQDVAEQVRRDDHVERLRVRDHARRQRVDVVLALRRRPGSPRGRPRRPPRPTAPSSAAARSTWWRSPAASAGASRRARRRSGAIRSMPCRVKTPVCSATSCGVPDVQPAADAGVLALGVLAHADHVDVGAARGWRSGDVRPGSRRIGRRFTYWSKRCRSGRISSHTETWSGTAGRRSRRGRWRRTAASWSKASASIIRPCAQVVVAAPREAR